MTRNDINWESSIVIYRHLCTLQSTYKVKVEECQNAVIAMEESDFVDTPVGSKQLDDMYELLEINEAVADKLESLVELFEKIC